MLVRLKKLHISTSRTVDKYRHFHILRYGCSLEQQIWRELIHMHRFRFKNIYYIDLYTFNDVFFYNSFNSVSFCSIKIFILLKPFILLEMLYSSFIHCVKKWKTRMKRLG